MSYFKWQEEAILKQRVLVKGARAAGKTEASIRWARHAGQSVLFAVPHASMIPIAMERMHGLYRREITRYQLGTGVISFNDGTYVQFVAPIGLTSMRGYRVDAVVLDEIGYMTGDQVLSVMACAAHSYDFKFFATYCGGNKSGVERILKLSDVDYITVDFLDMIEQGIVTVPFVREMYNMLPPKVFKEEFGPYESPKPKDKKNIFFKYLLDGAL